MRKQFISAGLALVAAAFSAVSCMTELKDGSALKTAGKQITLYVQDNEWLPEEGARSSYTEGVGIALDGTEKIALYYYENSQYNGNSGIHGVVGTPSGGGVYTFTDPGANPESKWYSLVPYSYIMQRVAPTSGTKYQYGQSFIGPVQYPGADTFDPQADILLGRPFNIDAGTGTITAFKRMVAPWRILVTGLEASEKIYSATVSLSGSPSSTSNCLAGSFSITFADSFEDVVFRGIGSTTKSRTITAFYGSGLSKKGDDGWPVWLMVNPIEIASGTEMTMTVTTADKIYTRTAAFPSDQELFSTQINKLNFNIKGDGWTSEDIMFQDFTDVNLTSGKNSLTTADGTVLQWMFPVSPKWRASEKDAGSFNKDALYTPSTGTVMVFPEVPSKSLKKIRYFLHPCSALSSTGITASVMYGADTLATYNASTVNTALGNGGYYNGGILDITVPDGYESLSGLTLKLAKDIIFSGAILFTDDPTDYGGDYYTAFTAGKYIRTGGMVFHKGTHTATSIAVTNQADLITAAASYDVIFLDGDSDDILTLSSNMTLGGKAIIGRYPDKQPVINTAARAIQPTGNMAFKNVTIKYGAHLIDMTNSSFSLAVDDCTVLCTDTNKAFIYDKHATNVMNNLYITNSVFVLTATTGFSVFYSSASKDTGVQEGYRSFLIKNNLFCNKTTLTSSTARLFAFNPYAKDGKTIVTMPNIVIEFDGNSVYGWPSRVIGVSQPGRLSVSYNVFEGALTAATYALHVNDNGTQRNYNSFCISNFARSTSSYAWNLSSTSNLVSDSNVAGTSGSPGDPFLASKDVDEGYLPINTSVVTNGAGATYETKLWRSWP
ncbi:MAG: hypothetical protein J5835_08510 [Bacteroidales bacterium]|nr:hypothetical protein [Bacteroidales bacterium]